MRKMLMIMIISAITITGGIGSISYLASQGYHLNAIFPFLWRESDEHAFADRTCCTLMVLGAGIKELAETKEDLGQLRSIEDIDHMLKWHNVAPEAEVAKDAWGNPLRVEVETKLDRRIILIYSSTANEFPMPPTGYNLFVQVVIDSQRNVSITFTRVSKYGFITLTHK